MNMIMTKKDYGSVELKLKQLLEERNVTRGLLSRAIGTRFEVVDRWCNGEVEKMDLDVLARICCVLDCQVSDLLEYSPLSQKEEKE